MKTTSRVFKRAHWLHKNKPGCKWAEIVKHAWYFEKFHAWLTHGVVTFSFFKENGDIREAKGTLCLMLVPFDKLPKQKERNDTKGVEIVTFFDINKQDWRSFKISRFIGFVSYYELKEKEPKRK